MRIETDWRSFKKPLDLTEKNLFPTGMRVYKGHQGKGKTLSMVHDAIKLKEDWPKCLIYSNVKIKNIEMTYCTTTPEIMEGLIKKNQGYGVLLILDEAHLFFNKKTGISLDVLAAISQQRKDRRKIFMTCQIWEDLDVSLRKQVKEIYSCDSVLNKIQVNRILNGETLHWDNMNACWSCDQIGLSIFKRNNELYTCYDTLAKIEKNDEYQRQVLTMEKIDVNNYYQKLTKK